MKKITYLFRRKNVLFFLMIPLLNIGQTANYDISVTTIWNTNDHTSVPANAHWSNLIGATHNTENQFMEIGQPATLGIKNVAEFGSNTEITNEINSAITNNTADQLLQDGFSPFAGNDSNAGFMSITVSEDYPLVTLVSMVAPSPDWFIAVNSLNLRSGNASINNGWKDTFTIDVFAYDAGTDSGANYESSNQVTSPFEPISLITGSPINGNKMATITFTYNSSTLSTNDLTFKNSIEIFPNPVSNIFTIKNLSNNQINSVSLYNVLGNLVSKADYNSKQQEITIPVNNLNSGIYLVKIDGEFGKTITRKLIIE